MSKLGRGGIFEASPNRLEFGTSLFYGRFAQYGTKKQQATPLINVDEIVIGQRLALWAKSRAAASGLEVAVTTPYQEAVLSYTDAPGGTWPPKAALQRWSGSGRYVHPLARSELPLGMTPRPVR